MCIWSLTKTDWEEHWADQGYWFWHRWYLAQVTSLKGYKWFKWLYTFPSFPTIYSCKTIVKNLQGDSISGGRIQEGCERKRERCHTTGGISLSLFLARSHGHRRWMPASHLLAVVPYSPPPPKSTCRKRVPEVKAELLDPRKTLLTINHLRRLQSPRSILPHKPLTSGLATICHW